MCDGDNFYYLRDVFSLRGSVGSCRLGNCPAHAKCDIRPSLLHSSLIKRRVLVTGGPHDFVLASRTGMTPTTEVQLVFALITVLGSGASVYVGVRVALAEIRTMQKSLERRVDKVEERLDRLEERYFK